MKTSQSNKSTQPTKSFAQMSTEDICDIVAEKLSRWCASKRFKRYMMVWTLDTDEGFWHINTRYPKHGKYPTLRFMTNLAHSLTHKGFLHNFLVVARWTIQHKREQMADDGILTPEQLKLCKKAEKAILDVELMMDKAGQSEPND